MRHGPHQVAQKSSRTGLSDSRTSLLKLSFVIVMTAIRNNSFGFLSIILRFQLEK